MPQREVELILIRQWASYMAMPIFMVGSNGSLLFYNEAAEHLLGRPYEEAGQMDLDQLPATFQIQSADGSPLAPDEFPLRAALQERFPAHRSVRYKAFDGVWRTVEVTAFPLEGHGGKHLGAVAVFWEVPSS